MDPNDIDITSADTGAEPVEPDEQQQGEPSSPEEEAQDQEGQHEGEDQDGEGEGEKKPEPNPVQKRINEITRARREAEAEAAALRKLIIEREQSRSAPESEQKPEGPQPPAPPKQEDFADYAAYQEALLDYKVEVKLYNRDLEARQRVQADSQQAAAARQQQESQQRAARMVESGRTAFDDFDDVVMAPDVRITPAMVDAMSLDAKTGSAVAYYLGKAPEEAARIASLPPVQQIMEIGRLAEKISASANKNKITKAPPPAKPVGGGRVTTQTDLSKVSIDDFMKARNKKKG